MSALSRAIHSLKTATMIYEARREQERMRVSLALAPQFVLEGTDAQQLMSYVSYAHEGWADELKKDERYNTIIRSVWFAVISANKVWKQYLWKLYGRVQERLCAPNGEGRLLDRKAFEKDNAV